MGQSTFSKHTHRLESSNHNDKILEKFSVTFGNTFSDCCDQREY